MTPTTVMCSCWDCGFAWETAEYVDPISGPEVEWPDCPRCSGVLMDEPDADRDELHVARLVRAEDFDVEVRAEDFDRTPAHLLAGIESAF